LPMVILVRAYLFFTRTADAAILLASPSYAKKRGLKPRARVVAMANMGDSPTLMLNAPVPATRKVLAKAGLGIDEIDLFEINEAFAVVAEKYIRERRKDDLRLALCHRCPKMRGGWSHNSKQGD
jgi:acetyl-CoA acetyltransferase